MQNWNSDNSRDPRVGHRHHPPSKPSLSQRLALTDFDLVFSNLLAILFSQLSHGRVSHDETPFRLSLTAASTTTAVILGALTACHRVSVTGGRALGLALVLLLALLITSAVLVSLTRTKAEKMSQGSPTTLSFKQKLQGLWRGQRATTGHLVSCHSLQDCV